MKDLASALNEDTALAAYAALARVFQLAGLEIHDYAPAVDKTTGAVVLNGDTFTYSGGTVRLLGYCQTCGQEIPSRPIRRLADIHDMRRNFKPDRHECIDV